MDNSILEEIKKLLGIMPEYNFFDADLIIHINTVFSVLNQMGVGPSNCFSINGSEELWSDFTDNDNMLQPVKTYIHVRVRKIFDPPSSSFVMDSINNTISELEWRLNVYADKE